MENNSANPNQQPLPVSQTPHRFSKEFFIVVLILLVIMIGVGGYILVASQNQIVQPQSQSIIPTTQPSQISETRTDPKGIQRFSANKLDSIPKFILPLGIEKAQLTDAQKIDGIYFVKFIKSNINFPVDSSVQRSGVLYAKDGDSNWKIFYEIKDLATKDISSYKNNPYDFWKENDLYFTVIVDTHGAGSGEGKGKLVSINIQTNQWKILDCFYYSTESYISHFNSLSETTSLSEGVKSYNDNLFQENNGDYIFDSQLNKFTNNGRVEESCTLFQLVI